MDQAWHYVVKREDGLYACSGRPTWTHLQRRATRFPRAGAVAYAEWCEREGEGKLRIYRILQSRKRPANAKARVVQLALALGVHVDIGRSHRGFSGHGHVWSSLGHGNWAELTAKGCLCELAHWLLATPEERLQPQFGLDKHPESDKRERQAETLAFAIGRVLEVPWCSEAPFAQWFEDEYPKTWRELVVRGLVTEDDFLPTFIPMNADGTLRLCDCGCGRLEDIPYNGTPFPSSFGEIFARLRLSQGTCCTGSCARHEGHRGPHHVVARDGAAHAAAG